MKKYFYSDGVNRHGPYTLDELRSKNITRQTKVWFQGLNDWRPAGTIPELSSLFDFKPPPIPDPAVHFKPIDNFSNQKPPKTWLVESILVTLFCCLPFGIAGIVNASKVESRFFQGDIHGAQRASAEAKKWTMVSFWVGIIISVFYFLAIMGGSLSGY